MDQGAATGETCECERCRRDSGGREIRRCQSLDETAAEENKGERRRRETQGRHRNSVSITQLIAADSA